MHLPLRYGISYLPATDASPITESNIATLIADFISGTQSPIYYLLIPLTLSGDNTLIYIKLSRLFIPTDLL